MHVSRRLTLAATALCLVALPGALEAQIGFLAGGGISSPLGDFADEAGTGYHLRAGFDGAIPTTPISVRIDGDYHRLAEADSGFESASVWAGAFSVVYRLPGVGIRPYLLGGIGKYRLKAGPAGMSTAVTDNGLHAGFGLNLGAIGFGGFVEIRYVQVNTAGDDTKYLPLTVGLRM